MGVTIDTLEHSNQVMLNMQIRMTRISLYIHVYTCVRTERWACCIHGQNAIECYIGLPEILPFVRFAVAS